MIGEGAISAERGLEPEGREIDILDFLLVISEGKKIIGGCVLLAALVAILASFVVPNRFVARTSLVPPQPNQSPGTLIAGQITAITGVSARDLGLKNPAELYVALLESDSVAESLIDRFRLKEVYRVRRLGDAREKLRAGTTINAGKDGLIVLTVEDRDPFRAADLANGYVDELQRLNGRLAITEASQRRSFFEKQLAAVKESVAQAERKLGETEARTGVVEVGAHARALVEQLASLRGQYAAKEVEVRSMQSFATEQNPDYLLQAKQLAALRAQLAKLEKGQGEGATGSMTKFSGAATEYIDALREVKYQEALFELLGRQYEAARLDEAREGMLVQVVDRAIPPEKPSWPKRPLLVAVSSTLAGFVSCLFVIFQSSIRRAAMDPLRREKYRRLLASWRAIRAQ